MKDVHFKINKLFEPEEGIPPVKSDIPLNGVAAANRAVENCDKNSSIIFLTKSEYEDLLSRARVSELRTYKKKTICVVSDEVEKN